ncbi:MAG: HD domain-containing protein [Planctomycetota bacterium]
MQYPDALDLLRSMTDGQSLLRHARAVEIVMRAQARARGGDEEQWGIAGLLHDADYEKWPNEHPHRIVGELRQRGEGELADAIAAHYTKWNQPYGTEMAKALVASDELTGFVMACALVRPDGIATLEPKSVLKRFKDARFAATVEREEVLRGCEVLGVALADHALSVIEALRPHAEELGLGPRDAR